MDQRSRLPAASNDGAGEPDSVQVTEISFRHTFRALKYRNYRLFFFGQLVSLIGTWMEHTAMGWLVYQLSGSKFLLGLVAAAGTAPMLLLSLWGGSVADRYPKRSILVVTQSVSMTLAFILAAIVWMGHVEPWHIVCVAVVNGVAMAFDMPARQAFVIELTSREDLLNAISLNSSVFNGARLLGPAVAGLVLERFSAAVCFLLNGVSFLAVIGSLLLMRIARVARERSDLSAKEHALGGLSYVRQNARVLTIMTLFGIVGIFGWSYSVLMPAYAKDILGLSAKGYGMLLSANGMGALIGALTIAAAGHRFQPRKIALAGLWLFSAALLAFSQVRQFQLALLFLLLVGFGMMLFFSTSNTTVQSIVPDDMRGRVMAMY
ncbi:MAG: MFS transporter, partial [Verrucomicrobiaceae bacterium]